MAYLYVVFSKTGTLMGKSIRLFTRNCYNHVSISLDKSLTQMYSFARKTRCAPLVGGFVSETPSRYLCEKEPADIKVCRVEISDKRYEEISSLFSSLSRNPSYYIYNSFSALYSVFGKKLKIRNSYTCLEFCANILNIDGINNIKQLENRLKSDIIYCGRYVDYLKTQDISPVINFNEAYFEKFSMMRICRDTVLHFYRLIKRLV